MVTQSERFLTVPGPGVEPGGLSLSSLFARKAQLAAKPIVED